VALADRQEAVLHHRLRHRRLGEQVLQRLGWPAGQRVLDRLGVVEAAEHRLAQRARQLVAVQDVREVGQRAGGAGDRDPSVGGAVRRGQLGPMGRDAGMAPVVLVVTSGLNSSPRRMHQSAAALR